MRVTTALLCHSEDENAAAGAAHFESMLGTHTFVRVTLDTFITARQRTELTRAQRSWTVMFWARDVDTRLSDALTEHAGARTDPRRRR